MTNPPNNLRCEYLKNPINIDTSIPRFSWTLEHKKRNQYQSAYQIIVSSDSERSTSETRDIWNSGKVTSKKSNNIRFLGKSLESNKLYYWRVKWWDKDGSESAFSDVAIFGMALLEESDWKAKWISKGEFVNKRTRREFQYKSGERRNVLLGNSLRERSFWQVKRSKCDLFKKRI